MDEFDKIKYSSYKKYARFSSTLHCFKDYDITIPDIDHAIFRLGQCEFKILPVCTSTKENFTLYGENHPSGLKFPQITEITKELNVSDIETYDKTAHFELSYKLSAIVCERVQGITLLSATSDQGSWTWFVILSADNKYAEKHLRTVKKNISEKEADQWFLHMNFK